MNENTLNRPLVEKNIEKIDYYRDEENKTLNKIYEKLEMCASNYSTSNKGKFLDTIQDKQIIMDKLLEKRETYCVILNNAINRYERVGIETINRFDGDIEDGR